MKTIQPSYRFAANLGDVNPFYNGALIYVDATGHYSPQLVYFDESDAKSRDVSRIDCDRCTMLANDPATLSDNHFHADKPAWFAPKLQSVADSNGIPIATLAKLLTSSNPIERASGYLTLISYFGVFEFDQYPVAMTDSEIRRKYRTAFKR